MTLDETIRAKLSEASTGSGRRELVSSDSASGWTVALTLDKQDELSCLLWELKVQRSSPLPGDVRSWADGVAARIRWLGEAIVVLEVDSQRRQAVLRSENVVRRKGAASYFEILLDGTSVATVRRYQVPVEGTPKREQVTFPLVHDALIQLVEDLTAR